MAKSRPAASKNLGNMQLTVWEGEWEGKKNYSYSLKKNKYNKETKKWEDSDSIFFTQPDIGYIIALLQETLHRNIKKRAIEQKSEPSQQVQQNFDGQDVTNQSFNDKDIPF